jgi:hypothetical protein
MSKHRSAPKACKECIHLETIVAANGQALYQTCMLFKQECETAIATCPIAAQYEVVLADYDRLIASDLFRNKT